MGLTIIQRGKYWYVRGTVAGRTVYETTKATRKSAAEEYRRQLEAGLIAEERDKGKKTFADAVEAYIRKGGEERFTEKLKDRLGPFPLDDLGQEVIDRTARDLYPAVKTSSLKRFAYDPFCAVMNYAASLGWTPYRKIKKPKAVRPSPKWATPEWFERFWPACSPQLLALTTFLAYTGCRVTEALSLTWDRVDLENASAYIPDTKTKTPRTVHLPPIVMERLQAIRGESKVFPWGKKDAVNQAIRRAVNRANKGKEEDDQIEYLSSHKLGSHTYATWMRKYAGLDQRGLVGTGRWKSLQSTMVYTHTIQSEDARKADNLPGAKTVQTARKRRKT